MHRALERRHQELRSGARRQRGLQWNATGDALEGIWPLDPGLTYAVGCVVTMPFCSAAGVTAQTAACSDTSGRIDWFVGI